MDRRRDPDRILAVLREIDADVIALQEADQRFGARASVIPRAALDDTPWRAVPVARSRRSLGWHGNEMLVRRDLDVLDTKAVRLPTLEPRGAVAAILRCGQVAFQAIGVHLDISGLRRRDQIRAVLKHAAEYGDGMPTVILGDFNQWGVATGAMREFGREWRVLTPGRTFPSRMPIAQLDRFAVNSHCDIAQAAVHHTALSAIASDHLPIVAVLGLPE